MDGSGYSPSMRRQMLRFLQKRKFRLVTRWKGSLKENMGFQLPMRSPFPYALIFRAFDEVLHQLKFEPVDARVEMSESFLGSLAGGATPTADQYMELFLTGRDVLGDFLETDASFRGMFPETERQGLRSALEQVFKHLIDREMREYARRFSSSVSH